MKRHFLAWLKITVFFILFIITFVILSAVVRPGGINLDTISGFYGEKEDSLDMVYIGGSAAFVYWEPLKAYEDIGIASYSFASDTMQAELYEYMIKEINKHHNPELIIIDARAFQYRKEDQPPSEVAYRNLLTGTPMNIDKINVINKVVPNYLSEDTFPYYFDIVKYHTSEIHHKQDFVKRLFFDYEYDTKGFYFVPKVDKITKYDNKTDKVMPLDKTTSEILDNLLKYIKTTKNKYLFIVSPYEELESHKEIFNYVESKVEDAGYIFIDANDYKDEMKLDYEKDFYNNNHVNIFGADKYTDFLEDFIVNNYNIIDHRNDKDYENGWNNNLEMWHQQVDSTKNEIERIIKEEQ